MTKHIKESQIKSSKGETLYLAGSPIHKELSEYLVAMAESLQMKMDAPSLMEVNDPLDTLGVGLCRLQQQMLKQKELRRILVAEEEDPA